MEHLLLKGHDRFEFFGGPGVGPHIEKRFESARVTLANSAPLRAARTRGGKNLHVDRLMEVMKRFKNRDETFHANRQPHSSKENNDDPDHHRYGRHGA